MKPNMRRTVLYVPGDSEKMLGRAAALDSDTLLLNLEDGVASSRKDAARANVAAALEQIDFGRREVVVRINSLRTDTGKRDLADIVPLGPDAVCLPKVEKGADILAAEALILELETRHKMPPGGIMLHAMIESAAGLLRGAEIANASPRMSSLVFGSADYASDLRCHVGEDRSELLLALQMIVVSARSAGIDAIDAPCFDIRNLDLLGRESAQARRMGFDGKCALHPDQLETINHVFDVTPEEIAWAEKVLKELDDAESRGKALTTVDGQLLDNPHRTAAERILAGKGRQAQ
ncbi:MAG: CoA ester lyase [Acidobacteria bacterium]|nr:CoA ester lyase [Acidobacteriota bacterium]